MKKKILYFMPDCPTEGKAGNITRCIQMLEFLNDSYEYNEVDFLSVSDWGTWTPTSTKAFHDLYPNINLILTNRKIDKKKHPVKSVFFYKIPNFLPKLLRGITIDISNPFLNKKVTKILNAKKYDKIIISYASWSSLVDRLAYKSYLILDSHDFITAQSRNKINRIGKLFQSEVKAMRKFDEIWTFSVEERYIFEQFTDSKVVHIPVSFPQKALNPLKQDYKYDVVYVASNNPHNVNSINWFLEKVLPYLKDNIKIHVIGKVGKEIKKEYPNVIIHGMVDDLQEFYDNARITICPMLSGTGVKIKVLESLSNNLPVVTNTRGVDGLSQKNDNGCLVTDDAKEFAGYIEILLKNDELYDDLRQKAHEFVKNNHSLEKETVFFKNKFS
ncbi:glycosyltransferase [Chryseobacterium indologenes]|uniref:Glycosyltransferase n=1 Tax=Chryseobacterium indologenes TaxID=253 RepID=A0AAD0YWV7_CHRID|nr:glycosyltransferase [Chryseobacterium indologenes]AZB18607.1 glycosyltransferase [Chryseobacterium indologenes]